MFEIRQTVQFLIYFTLFYIIVIYFVYIKLRFPYVTHILYNTNGQYIMKDGKNAH